MGISAGLVKQRNFPALDIVRSPQYNLFYEAAAGNPMHEQAQRMHNAQVAEVELKQAASATGVSHHELKAEMQQMRQAQTNQGMAMGHFGKMHMQEMYKNYASLASQVEQLDLRMALQGKQSATFVTPSHTPIAVGTPSGMRSPRDNPTPPTRDTARTSWSGPPLIPPEGMRPMIGSEIREVVKDNFGPDVIHHSIASPTSIRSPTSTPKASKMVIKNVKKGDDDYATMKQKAKGEKATAKVEKAKAKAKANTEKIRKFKDAIASGGKVEMASSSYGPILKIQKVAR
jgi:hypothetical protein